MSKQIQNQYFPDDVTPPGEMLQDTLGALGMSQAELAARMGRPKKTINELILGKAAITPETAIQLEQVLGVPASFWNNGERRYRDFLARTEAARRLASQTAWLDEVPALEMVKRGWIQRGKDKVGQLVEVLSFFGVSSPEQWKTLYSDASPAFRKSPRFEGSPGAVSAWLRRGETKAQQIESAPYDAKKFREVLKRARVLTKQPVEAALEELVGLCASAGVALVVVPELPGVTACGAAEWLSPTKALIILSWRYKSDDQFWFTFFHEAGHILLHGKRDVYIDARVAGEQEQPSDIEVEADQFASTTLIPQTEWERLLTMDYRDADVIQEFANQLDIAPGIVVGKLQHNERLPYDRLNTFKRSYRQFSKLEIPAG